MAWFWTDDLAHALLDAGMVEEASVRSWLDRPEGIAAPADSDPVALGATLLGIDAEEAGAA